MNKWVIRSQVALGTAFLAVAFWEAHVAKTHEPTASYNDASIAAYYFVVMKCVINIFSGLMVYLECVSTESSVSQMFAIQMIHYGVSMLGIVLYMIGILYPMLEIYHLMIILDTSIIILFIVFVNWAKHRASAALVPEVLNLGPIVNLDPALVYPDIV